jgi:hypothetical protein
MAMNAFRLTLVFFAIACIGNLSAEAAYNENAICLDSIDESCSDYAIAASAPTGNTDRNPAGG